MKVRPINPFKLTTIFLFPFFIALAIFLTIIIIWEKKKSTNDQLSEMREVANAVTEQIMVARSWNAKHGGVYVEISPDNPPNPYIDLPDRDIVTLTGKKYTMINPAYMTRQLSDISSTKGRYRFYLVSNNPLNPVNKPDKWEHDMLMEFEQGTTKDAMMIYRDDGDGKRYFKYLTPLRIESPCLRCHGKHGYEINNIKGGLSIIIPMENSDYIHSIKFRRNMIYLLSIGALSSLFMIVITFILSRRLNLMIEKNIEYEKLSAIIELAGATAHEMRQPMTVIYNLVGLMREKIRTKEPISDEEMDLIIKQSSKMNDIIKKMLHITRYKTKDYIKDKRIIDIEASSEID